MGREAKSKLPESALGALAEVERAARALYDGPARCALVHESGELRCAVLDRCRSAAHPDGRPRRPPRSRLSHLTRPRPRPRYVSETGPTIDAAALENVCVLRRASTKMGRALDGGVSVPATHVRGEATLTSAFDVGGAHVFVVLADVQRAVAESFDGKEAERRMRGVLEGLVVALKA